MSFTTRRATAGRALAPLTALAFAAALASLAPHAPAESVARQWNDALLDAIRVDTPRPTVHARNLFHTSAAVYDAWAAYDPQSRGYLVDAPASAPGPDSQADREQTISFAAYRLLNHRFADSPGGPQALPAFDRLITRLGYDPSFTSTVGDSPAALGNRIAQRYIAYGLSDHANEANDYADAVGYSPSNPPLVVAGGDPTMADPDRWQPLTIQKNGQPVTQSFLTPHWGNVKTFAAARPASQDPLTEAPYASDLVGPPPAFGTTAFQQDALEVIRFSATLDPTSGETINISPRIRGNAAPGSNDGSGHRVNPVTGEPYADNIVPLGDWGRVLAEFWADGPNSETPPGHWNAIANEVSDHPGLVKRIGGERGGGPVVSDLEWDAKLHFALNAAAHDSAVVAWDLKRQVDYVRPISMIRYMGSLGQSSDPTGPAFNPNGLPLEPGLVELVTADTAAPGGRHEGLEVGTVAIRAWRGFTPGSEADPAPGNNAADPADGDTFAGVGWIAAVDWRPYQAEDFVTPAFPGYISGHSTFSRAMAEVLAAYTGDEYFPGGVGEFNFEQGRGLNFEDGPTEDILLQWATYTDAADEAGLSRLYGGIHVRADDFDGRIVGEALGQNAYALATGFFNGSTRPGAIPTPAALPAGLALLAFVAARRRRDTP